MTWTHLARTRLSLWSSSSDLRPTAPSPPRLRGKLLASPAACFLISHSDGLCQKYLPSHISCVAAVAGRDTRRPTHGVIMSTVHPGGPLLSCHPAQTRENYSSKFLQIEFLNCDDDTVVVLTIAVLGYTPPDQHQHQPESGSGSGHWPRTAAGVLSESELKQVVSTLKSVSVDKIK